MWMTDYVREVKRQLRDVYGLTPSREEGGEPCFENVPDGIYPMVVDGRSDNVVVNEGRFLLHLPTRCRPGAKKLSAASPSEKVPALLNNALSEDLLTPYSLWFHPKTNGLYIFLGLAPDSTNAKPSSALGTEGKRYVVYWSVKYKAQRVREVREFLDGRFVPFCPDGVFDPSARWDAPKAGDEGDLTASG
jgi:hypothetical protein